MGNKAIRDMLLENLREDILIFDEPMKNHTTFRSGGKCDVLAIPGSVEDIRRLNRLCKKNGIPMIVIGNGSNLLIREGGIRGVVLKLAENFCYATVSDNSVTAQAGALLSSIAMKAMNSSLSGLEFASGIPGTVGGGV
ncbi:MAG: FAD-binding protein, partial [Clostridia bacterium]